MLATRTRVIPFAVALLAGAQVAAVSCADDAGFTTGSSDPLIRVINEQIRAGYTDNEIKPSPVADDYEWLRRVYLDLAGHIPFAATIREFVENDDDAKRSDSGEPVLSRAS